LLHNWSTDDFFLGLNLAEQYVKTRPEANLRFVCECLAPYLTWQQRQCLNTRSFTVKGSSLLLAKLSKRKAEQSLVTVCHCSRESHTCTSNIIFCEFLCISGVVHVICKGWPLCYWSCCETWVRCSWYPPRSKPHCHRSESIA